MAIYIILLFFILINILIYDLGSKEHGKKKISFYFSCIVLAIVAGIRYHIGSDTANYIEYFENVPELANFFKEFNLEALTQPLWFMLLSVTKTVFSDFLGFQFLHALVVNLLIGKFIYTLCQKPFVALLVYFCCCWWNFNFEIMRESLCVAIYINLFKTYTNNNDIKQFALRSAPLLFIHMFAIIPIMLTVVVHFFKYKTIFFVGLVVTAILFFVLSNDAITNLLLMGGSMMGESFADRVTMYVEGDKYGFKSLSILGVLLITITSVIYPMIVSKSKVVNNGFSKMLLLYSFVVILRMKMLIFIRICNYWEIMLLVFAVNFIYTNRKSIKKYYVAICLCFAMFKSVNTFLSPQPSQGTRFDCRYIPYASYIEKSVHPTREFLYY